MCKYPCQERIIAPLRHWRHCNVVPQEEINERLVGYRFIDDKLSLVIEYRLSMMSFSLLIYRLSCPSMRMKAYLDTTRLIWHSHYQNTQIYTCRIVTVTLRILLSHVV